MTNKKQKGECLMRFPLCSVSGAKVVNFFFYIKKERRFL